MRWMARAKALIIALSMAGLIFSSPPHAIACSCVGPRGKAAVKASLVAFRGTVTAINYVDPDTAQTEPRIIVTFSVSRVWKGSPGRVIVLHTIFNKYSCAGFYFKKGKEYLVFAYRNKQHMAKRFPSAQNTLGTDICNGTNLTEHAGEDLREMGKGRKPK